MNLHQRLRTFEYGTTVNTAKCNRKSDIEHGDSKRNNTRVRLREALLTPGLRGVGGGYPPVFFQRHFFLAVFLETLLYTAWLFISTSSRAENSKTFCSLVNLYTKSEVPKGW